MRVLFTRNLSERDLKLASTRGLIPEVFPLIAVEFHSLQTLGERHKNLTETLSDAQSIAFTSQNAVDALFRNEENDESQQGLLNEILTILRKKPVYTVGEATADSLDVFGIMARFPDDYNGYTLAKMMQNDGVNKDVLHFCGSLRRPEFRQSMKSASIEVTEIEVYKKAEVDFSSYFHGNETQVGAFLRSMKAVAFYSPSAVQAFFAQHLAQHFSGEWFAIGSTTGNELKKFGVDAKIPRMPTSELLIEQIAKTM